MPIAYDDRKTDLNFISICENNESRCILAHVRAATSHPIVRTNNHPFSFGRHSIMHNGTIAFFPKIVRTGYPHMKQLVHLLQLT
jgi:glutamine amidotransferase